MNPPAQDVNPRALKRLIQLALDSYLEGDNISANIIHDEAKNRHGKEYQSPGYYLRLYRNRESLTQSELAEQLKIYQHHISEMESNKRVIGKALAKTIAQKLNFDYHKLL